MRYERSFEWDGLDRKFDRRDIRNVAEYIDMSSSWADESLALSFSHGKFGEVYGYDYEVIQVIGRSYIGRLRMVPSGVAIVSHDQLFADDGRIFNMGHFSVSGESKRAVSRFFDMVVSDLGLEDGFGIVRPDIVLNVARLYKV